MGQLNPTRQEILAAHDALNELRAYVESYGKQLGVSGIGMPLFKDLCKEISKALPPIPHPTMAEIEWDDDKHRLAEAEHPTHGNVIMLNDLPDVGRIKVLFKEEERFHISHTYPESLTPTGRRYVLQEKP